MSKKNLTSRLAIRHPRDFASVFASRKAAAWTDSLRLFSPGGPFHGGCDDEYCIPGYMVPDFACSARLPLLLRTGIATFQKF
jgi:hypothetical protein